MVNKINMDINEEVKMHCIGMIHVRENPKRVQGMCGAEVAEWQSAKMAVAFWEWGDMGMMLWHKDRRKR